MSKILFGRLRNVITGVAFFCLFFTSWAQEIIVIETSNNAWVLHVSEQKDLNTIYLGDKLNDQNEYAQVVSQYQQGTDYSEIYNAVYTPAGSKNLLEPAIQLTHADGNASLSLNFVSKEVTTIDQGITQTEIVLKDPAYDIEVRLFFKAYHDANIIETWSAIKNSEKGVIKLHKYASANLYLHGNNDFWLTHYSGDWALEMIPEITKLSHGIKVLNSKLGTRTNLFQPS